MTCEKISQVTQIECRTNVSCKSVSVHLYRNLCCGKLDTHGMGTLIVEWRNTWLERGGSKEYTSKISRGYIVSSDSTNIFCFGLCENVQKIPPKLHWSVTPRTTCSGQISSFIFKKTPTQTNAAWKKRIVNRRSLAATFSIGISSSRKGGPLHHRS